ncbi:hypothetical protein [Microbulbifer agarilyticus]
MAHSANDVSVEQLMRQADLALYRAKQQGRNQVVDYASEADAATERRLTTTDTAGVEPA